MRAPGFRATQAHRWTRGLHLPHWRPGAGRRRRRRVPADACGEYDGVEPAEGGGLAAGIDRAAMREMVDGDTRARSRGGRACRWRCREAIEVAAVAATSAGDMPRCSIRWRTTPGSSWPGRVPIGRPARAVTPTVLSTLRPPVEIGKIVGGIRIEDMRLAAARADQRAAGSTGNVSRPDRRHRPECRVVERLQILRGGATGMGDQYSGSIPSSRLAAQVKKTPARLASVPPRRSSAEPA
jgi:hypothetical protein